MVIAGLECDLCNYILQYYNLLAASYKTVQRIQIDKKIVKLLFSCEFKNMHLMPPSIPCVYDTERCLCSIYTVRIQPASQKFRKTLK